MEWKIGYNTNGFGSHRLLDALHVIWKIGYNSVALTLDHCHLDPLYTTEEEIQEVRHFLEDHGMACFIETGGRYLLDPWRKHYPSLVSEGWQKRLDLLKRSIEIGLQLGAVGMTFFSGAAFGVPVETCFERLSSAISELLKMVESENFVLALEPEPGMVVEGIADYLYVKEMGGFQNLRMTLDIGHVW